MKRSFLNRFAGMPAEEAEAEVRKAGYDPLVLSYGTACIALAMGGTVKLWLGQDGRVDQASAGDPLEVEEDS